MISFRCEHCLSSYVSLHTSCLEMAGGQVFLKTNQFPPKSLNARCRTTFECFVNRRRRRWCAARMLRVKISAQALPCCTVLATPEIDRRAWDASVWRTGFSPVLTYAQETTTYFNNSIWFQVNNRLAHCFSCVADGVGNSITKCSETNRCRLEISRLVSRCWSNFSTPVSWNVYVGSFTW